VVEVCEDRGERRHPLSAARQNALLQALVPGLGAEDATESGAASHPVARSCTMVRTLGPCRSPCVRASHPPTSPGSRHGLRVPIDPPLTAALAGTESLLTDAPQTHDNGVPLRSTGRSRPLCAGRNASRRRPCIPEDVRSPGATSDTHRDEVSRKPEPHQRAPRGKPWVGSTA
jgi:hypothetical protein